MYFHDYLRLSGRLGDDRSRMHSFLQEVEAGKTNPDLFGVRREINSVARTLVTENLSTPSAMMFPESYSKLGIASQTMSHIRILNPFGCREKLFLHQYDLKFGTAKGSSIA